MIENNFILNEATNLSAFDKMLLFNNGQRRENVKACGDAKLQQYYQICKINGFNNALIQIEAEMISRGLIQSQRQVTPQTAPNSTPSYLAQLIGKLQTSDFHLADASFIKEHQANYKMIVANCETNSVLTSLSKVRALVIYLIWGIVLKLDSALIAEFKRSILQNGTIDELRILVQSILGNQEIVARLNDIATAV